MKGNDWYYSRLGTGTIAKTIKGGVWYAIVDWDGKQVERKIYYTKEGLPYCICGNLKCELRIPAFDNIKEFGQIGDKIWYQEIY
jgi:hypothetical protein